MRTPLRCRWRHTWSRPFPAHGLRVRQCWRCLRVAVVRPRAWPAVGLPEAVGDVPRVPSLEVLMQELAEEDHA